MDELALPATEDGLTLPVTEGTEGGQAMSTPSQPQEMNGVNRNADIVMKRVLKSSCAVWIGILVISLIPAVLWLAHRTGIGISKHIPTGNRAGPSASRAPSPPSTPLVTPSPDTPLAPLFASLTNLRYLDPPEWCNSRAERRVSAAACEATYVTMLGTGELRRCVHDAATENCVALVLQPTLARSLENQSDAPFWLPAHPPELVAPPQGPASLLDSFNSRYKEGRPSNNFFDAGLFVTMVAPATQIAWSHKGMPWPVPWIPTIHGNQVDRLSGSIINKNLPGIFDFWAGYGLLLEPVRAQRCLMCSYPLDAGSTGPKPCRYSAFLPDQLEQMMSHHQGGGAVKCPPACYNEVILRDGIGEDGQCFRDQMPDIVEAFFANSASLSDQRQNAERAHALFVEHFDLGAKKAPLLLVYMPGEGFATMIES